MIRTLPNGFGSQKPQLVFNTPERMDRRSVQNKGDICSKTNIAEFADSRVSNLINLSSNGTDVAVLLLN